MSSNIDLIGAVPLFSKLPRKTLERFANVAIERKFDTGANIVTEGDAGVAMYVIADGNVAVMHPGEAAPRATLNQGAAFGEMALVGDQRRSATITALTPVTCLALPRWDFIAEVRANGDFAMELVEALATRVHDLETLVAKLESEKKT